MTDDYDVSALRAGKEEALTALFDTHADRVYRLALGMLGDEAEAEDVVQETFVKAMNGLDRFEGRSAPGTWLYRVAHNACVDRLRARGREVSAEPVLEGELAMPENFVDWSDTPEEVLLDGEARAVLDRATAQLSEALRAVFLLRDVDGLSTADTAEALGISRSAAKVRLHRARLELREHLSGYFGERLEGGAS